MSGHMMRECPRRGIGGMARLTESFIASSSSMPYSGRGAQPMGRVRGDRGATSSSGAQNRTYSLADRQNLEASPDVVTGMLSIFSFNLYALIDPGSTYLMLLHWLLESSKEYPNC